MATKLTSCPNCGSYFILELNPEIRETSHQPLVGLNCECNECSNKFTVKTWTHSGRRKGIKY
jgi:RNase P subunit RPR2